MKLSSGKRTCSPIGGGEKEGQKKRDKERAKQIQLKELLHFLQQNKNKKTKNIYPKVFKNEQKKNYMKPCFPVPETPAFHLLFCYWKGSKGGLLCLSFPETTKTLFVFLFFLPRPLPFLLPPSNPPQASTCLSNFQQKLSLPLNTSETEKTYTE